MSESDPLLVRIRGEFSEMPGLRLTLAQACRLWHLERAMCEGALQRLVAERYLYELHDGSFVAWPKVKAPLRATLSEAPLAERRRRA
jgi:hypothetical protein